MVPLATPAPLPERLLGADPEATTVPGGYFIPEEAPSQLVERLVAFLPRAAHPRGE